MQLDPAIYRHHIDALDMSDDAKLAHMQTVWSFLEGALDRQSGEAPEQTLLWIRARQAALDNADPLDSKPALIETYNDAARGSLARKTIP